MNEIVPAILPRNYEDLKNKIALVKGVVDVVQIDICDGVFVPSRSWPFNMGDTGTDLHFNKIINEEEGLPFWEDVSFELDLMTVDAVSNFDLYTKLGAKRVIIHLESVDDVSDFKNFLEGIDMYHREMTEVGVAINVETPSEKLFSLVENIDFVQLMGIDKIGFQGEVFDDEVLNKITELKNKFPDLIISVDGGVDFDSAPKLLERGVSRLVVGSAIFSAGDILGVIEEFRNIN